MGNQSKVLPGMLNSFQKSANETSKVVENMAASISQVAQNAQNVNELSEK